MNTDNISALSASRRKLISSLQQPRHRRELRLFVAEGAKCISELTGSFRCRMLVATHAWLEKNDMALPPDAEIAKATRADMERISSMSTPPEVIALMEMPEASDRIDSSGLTIALDGVQDPGNLGTIIRVADWYGITDILASRETADCFAPKVIQATMGSISRVAVHYCDLPATLSALGNVKIYGTFLDGDDIDTVTLSPQGIIVIGNEGNGISDPVASLVTDRITLPSWPAGRPTGESLNAAIATAITVSKFRAGR